MKVYLVWDKATSSYVPSQGRTKNPTIYATPQHAKNAAVLSARGRDVRYSVDWHAKAAQRFEIHCFETEEYEVIPW